MLGKFLFAFVLGTSLCACSGSDTPKEVNQKNSLEKNSLEKTLEPQLDAIKKAEELEDEMLKSFEERDKKMRDSGI